MYRCYDRTPLTLVSGTHKSATATAAVAAVVTFYGAWTVLAPCALATVWAAAITEGAAAILHIPSAPGVVLRSVAQACPTFGAFEMLEKEQPKKKINGELDSHCGMIIESG